MTQFMQKSFSVYCNSITNPYVCDICHHESHTFYIEGKTRICYGCKKEAERKKLLFKISTARNDIKL